jgi:formate dehydrogenase subunit gamma
MRKARKQYQRWDIHQRIQHWILVAAFTTLVVTGMPLKYPGALSSRFIMRAAGGPESAGIVHRVAAVMLITVSVYHIAYLIYRLATRRFSLSMIAGRKDVQDVIGMIGYFFGLRKKKPEFGRYSFKEKSEYWAVIWGSAVMIGSGLILWFPEQASNLFRSHSALAFDVARVLHSYEALLAMLAIIVWHLYNAHLAAEVFPMSWVWITGKISEEQLKAEHPLEYEEYKKAKPRARPQVEPKVRIQPEPEPAASNPHTRTGNPRSQGEEGA